MGIREKYQHLRALGQGPIKPPKGNPPVIETVLADGPITVRLDLPNLVSFCPVTEQPDYGSLIIEYVADEYLIETKSLKMHLMSYMHEDGAAFGEDITWHIARGVYTAAEPTETFVVIAWAPRGGIGMTTSVRLDKKGEVIKE
jgi:7-cyano-7-deazaguanine reductase